MKSIDLYLSVLKDVRYHIMDTGGFCLNDFTSDSKGYELLCAFNEAANKLSYLINIMEYEKKC